MTGDFIQGFALSHIVNGHEQRRAGKDLWKEARPDAGSGVRLYADLRSAVARTRIEKAPA